jgi:Ran GTPase-activating protein (RanGAP) involved in mRNA processing and transport
MLRQNHTLQTLDLVNTQFGEIGFRALLEVLKNDNRTLQRLYLGSNGISSRGAQMLADMLRVNRNLKALLLNVNHIGDEGAICLADALNENESLEELGLASNGISFLGMEALLKAAMQHPPLRFLDLGYSRSTKALGAKPNQLHDADMPPIAALLQTNSALRRLDLRGTGLAEEGKTHLAQALQDNETLCELHLPGKRPDELTRILKRNREKTPETEQLSHSKPFDVALIKSVYRTV